MILVFNFIIEPYWKQYFEGVSPVMNKTSYSLVIGYLKPINYHNYFLIIRHLV